MSEDQEEMSTTQKLVHKKTPTHRQDVLVSGTLEGPFPTPEGRLNTFDENAYTPAKQVYSAPLLPGIDHAVQVTPSKSNQHKNRDVANAQMLQEQCQQLCLSVFFREGVPVRSLGFTSSISGEGKSFLARVTAEVLAHDSTKPVTLLECDWEHPSLAEYFGFPAVPGLAEWLRNECSESVLPYRLSHNLSIIPAGNMKQDAIQLLQQIRLKGGLVDALPSSDELLIVDLPAITTTGYGSLAASLVESLILVVRAGVTPDFQIAETCRRLKDFAVQGIILNQVKSRIPGWIQQLLS